MSPLPETILQFGSGKFLRAFADLFIHQANEQGQNIGRVVVVQSTGSDRASSLMAQGGRYQVVIRGYENGETIDRVEECASLSRALVAGTQWNELRRVICSPDLRFILSNTTEAGFNTDPDDRPEDTPPRSFPAKLIVLLGARFDAGLPGLTIIPCELLEGNASLLRATVLKLAEEWRYHKAFITWLRDECVWLHTLVDRIVAGTPMNHPLLASDPMLIMAEPFAFWALEEHPKAFPFVKHPAIKRTQDVMPYFLRKVRILNAGHTALLIKAMPLGYRLVREAMQDKKIVQWLESLLFDEIVPLLAGRVEEPDRFARQTLDRFRNPFLDHKFSDIALHQYNKIKIRLQSSLDEYIQHYNREPVLLKDVVAEGLASLKK